MHDAEKVDEVRDALRAVMDPELNLNVVELGMIRNIELADDKTVVSMVLTTMTCPFWELFVDQVKTALADVQGLGEVVVKYDPRRPWTPEMLSDSARWELEVEGLLPTHSWLS